MAGIRPGVLEMIGHTPLARLQRLPLPGSAQLLCKLENRNPSGSVKDRIALAVIDAAVARGELEPDGGLVWATGGNSGAALAMVAAAKGYPLTIFMPSNAPLNQRRLVERFGARVELTSPNAGMNGALAAARVAAKADPDQLLLDIFNDPAVVETHYRHTGIEIVEAVGPSVGAFVAAVGTGGTISGVGQRLKEVNPSVRIIAVEPAGSPMLSRGTPGRHMIPGIGADFVPPLLDRSLLDSVVTVSDADAGSTARRLAQEEGLLVGISSGANVFAALAVAQQLGEGATVVTVLPDTGERYLDFPLEPVPRVQLRR